MNEYNFPVNLQPIFLSDGKEIEKRRAVVRTDTMRTLGIVSDGYGLVKHEDVIDSFREAGKEYGVLEKISLTKEGAHLFYEMTFPKVEIEVKKGDLIKMMMIAKNSYNGLNSLQVIFGAYRLVCENGMILGTQFLSFNYRHVGDVGGLNQGIIKDSYSNYIRLFGERMPQITRMARVEIIDPKRIFSKEVVSLPEYLREQAVLSFEAENDRTVWGYYNALTYAITHKTRSTNPAVGIAYGIEAWKAAEKALNGGII